MSTPADPDPRSLFNRALDQAERQVAAVRPEELGNATPCADYDLRALLGHLISVLRKLARVGTGRDAREVADVIDGVADTEWAATFARARGEVDEIWADDALLDRMVTLPWATLPGRTVMGVYAHEFTVHSWDVAHATNRLDGLDPLLAEQALEAFAEILPPDDRDPQGPFGPVVPVPADADAYTRLAAFVGRQPHGAPDRGRS